MIKIEEIAELLSNAKLNSKRDHYIADCPFCNKPKHFYLNKYKIFNKKNGLYTNAWDCKKCSEKGNLLYLLKQLNALYLLDGEYVSMSSVPTLSTSNKSNLEKENLFLPEIKLPIGFKRVYEDNYLSERGFEEIEFKKYIVGRTNLVYKLKDYVIIAVVEGGKIRAYLSRITWNKEKLNEFQKKTGLKKLRYINSKHDFSKLLLGYDEIRFNTEWVVLVEGYFDKTSLDKHLNLDSSPFMKCCCTFGKSISNNQIEKLKLKGVKNIIIIQDPDAINDTKNTCYILEKEFEKVLVGYTDKLDLGDSNKKQTLKVFENLKTPLAFNLEIVNNLSK